MTPASLSARRAWIEIIILIAPFFQRIVALRKESVDRNFFSMRGFASNFGRSPQGERG